MQKATLTKRVEFSASHRYHNRHWDAEKNRAIFGSCNNEPSHGHNYMLELTLKGDVDRVTGMIINLYDLKQILTQVLEEFDHKHLNLDTPYFHEKIPTTENFAWILWDKFSQQPESRELDTLRLSEGEDLCAEITAGFQGTADLTRHLSSSLLREARIIKRYWLNPMVIHSGFGPQAIACILEITIFGPIDPETGRVTDILALDRIVRDYVINPLSNPGHSIRNTLFLPGTGKEALAKCVWEQLQGKILEGKLEKIALQEFNHGGVEYRG